MKIQMFRPADIDRIIKTSSKAGHPTLNDIEAMARDTIAGAGLGFTPTADQVEDARQTIEDIHKEKSSCHQSTAKKSSS
jgi:hypothetical protein